MNFNQHNSIVHKRNLDENLILLEQLGVEITDNDFIIQDILKQISPEKIKLLFEANIIILKDDIINIKEIINLNINNIKVFLKTLNENELLTLINSKNISYFYDIIKNLNSYQFRAYIERLGKTDFIKLINHNNGDFLNGMNLDLYLKEDNLPSYIKYKLKTNDSGIDNPYLSEYKVSTVSKVFSIINQESYININKKTNRGFLYEDKDGRSFYDVNNKNDDNIGISKEKQLELNRIFSPFINSTNLLNLSGIKGGKKIVSIDVNNKYFQELNEMKNGGLDDNLLMIQGLIYQFMTLDSDRDLSQDSETSNYINKTLIDFDRIGIGNKKNGNFYDLEEEKEKFNFSDKDLEIIIDIITFFKGYIVLLANENLKLNQGNNTMWENLKYRAQKLNGLNIFLSGFYSIKNNDIDKIINIDKQIIKKYEEN